MGFLDRLNKSQNASIENWQNLTSIDQLSEIDELSKSKSVVIFKHSTTCGISAGAKYRLESNWGQNDKGYHFYYLDLLQYRHISNRIAEKYGVRHESPQTIVINDGRATYNSSHQAIHLSEIERHTV